MNNLAITDGIWVKTSKDVSGWNSIVGPDILIINNNCVKTIFLHTDLVYDYEIVNSKLILKTNKENNNQEILLQKNGLMSLSGKGYNFIYFKIHESKNKVIAENFKSEILGKRFIDEKRIAYFEFEDSTDVDTGENLMKYNFDSIERRGKWSIYNFNDFILMELNMADVAERRQVIIDEITKLNVRSYYVRQDGVKQEIIFWK